MNDLQIFSERLKEIRIKLNLTQKQLGDMVNANSATISAYETGIKNPSLGIVKQICEKCKVSLDWLCGLSNNNDTDEVKTYGDIIKLLVKLSEGVNVYIMTKAYDAEKLDLRATGELIFLDTTVIDFFSEWGKTKNLYEQDIIDLELYSLWIHKKINDDKYNVPLAEKYTRENPPF